MIVAITGASGFLGSALTRSLRDDGISVVRIGRGSDADVRWDPPAGQLDSGRLAGVDAVVHLAGENVGKRWTSRVKREIRDSRVYGTSLIARTIAALNSKPRVFVSASAAGIYGAHRGDEILTESSTFGDDFMARVAKEWEDAAQPVRDAGIRVVHTRTGVVMNRSSGMLERLAPIFSLGIGGEIGSGKQWLPWIARTDWVRAVRFMIDSNLVGAFNLSAPDPVTNAEFTATLGRVLKRPTLTRVPEFAVKLMFGEMGEDTVLASQRMIPELLLSAGFRFDYPQL
ncbi:MAG TPA: TIGR01777 family oxidoreductase, partial [Gemmatimonadaceae bacterium]|nr:TIGR01777 family oxidoreductase [Gemmatimonadaceae bacterium]